MRWARSVMTALGMGHWNWASTSPAATAAPPVEQRLEGAALAIEGAVALGGADPDRHEREPRPFREIAEPIFVAEAVVGVSSPAVSADQHRRRARFPCRPRGRRLTKKAADVREDAG